MLAHYALQRQQDLVAEVAGAGRQLLLALRKIEVHRASFPVQFLPGHLQNTGLTRRKQKLRFEPDAGPSGVLCIMRRLSLALDPATPAQRSGVSNGALTHTPFAY